MGKIVFWPPAGGGGSSSNASVGQNGAVAPTSSTEIGFIDGAGNEQGVSSANPLPTVVLASVLPTGASTSSLQASGNSQLTTIASNQTNGTQVVAVNNFPATQPVSGTVTVVQPTGTNLHTTVDSSALPTGASTATLQTQISGQLPATLGAKTTANSMAVNIASDQTVPTKMIDTAPATQAITVIDGGSSTVTGFNNQPLITGTPTAGSAASYAVTSQESIAVEISGTWTGTLQFEVSIDGGTTWTPHGVHQIGSPNFVTTVNANFIASLNIAGKTNFRTRATAAITGTATTRIITSAFPSTVYIANSLKLIDSTAAATPVGMTIKAASTAPLATDSAIVVAISPNTPAITSAVTPTKGTLTDGSGTTSATPSTATTAAAINATRKYFFISNDSLTATIWFNFTTTAVAAQPSVQLLPGAGFVQESGFISTELISIISTTASVPYTLKQA